MHEQVVAALRCPVCTRELTTHERSLVCGAGHTFDIARQGYVNLLAGDTKTGTADTADMVAARVSLFATGAFARLSTAIAHDAARLLRDAPSAGMVTDVGAGTGHHLASVLDGAADRFGLALDLSKHAARVAARAHPRADAAVADTWGRLPLADASAALLLCVFAPRNAGEFARVLGDGGKLLVVTPNQLHLAEISSVLGLLNVNEDKMARLSRTLDGSFEVIEREDLTYVTTLTREDALAAARMGPAASHATPEELASRAGDLPERVDVTVSVTLSSYRPA